MGARGHAPTPTELLRARGSWRANEPGRQGEPQLPVEAPACPPFLSEEAKREWRRTTKQLLLMRCISQADRACLAAYCDAWADFARLAARTDDAAFAAKDKAVMRLLKLAQQFGLTPSARARVRAVEVPAEGANEDERFFGKIG